MDTVERDRMVVENLPLVSRLVSVTVGAATHLSWEDLTSAGTVALIEAVDAYDPDRGVPFGAFARDRIIGAVKDELRRDDWATRTVRQQITDTMTAQDQLTARLGRTPTVAETAAALGVDASTASQGVAYAQRTLTALDEHAETLSSSTPLPEDAAVTAESSAFTGAAVAALPSQLRYLIEQLFFQGRSVTELAAELGVSHSAVSQQRRIALDLLRDGFDTFYDGEDRDMPANTGRRAQAYLTELSGLVRA